MRVKPSIKVIAFDADDTLWSNEPYFQSAQIRFGEIISEWIQPEDVVNEHYATECVNIPTYGYGIKAFTLSLIDTAIRVSNGKVPTDKIKQILDLGKEMHAYPVKLLDGVSDTLETLGENYRMVVATKGDLLDQQRKLKRSNLEKHFHHIEVMSEKTESHYTKLIQHLDINPAEFLMVGNSLKSDILPVLNIGAKAIHIPFHVDWIHESVPNFDNQIEGYFQVESIRSACTLIHELFQSDLHNK